MTAIWLWAWSNGYTQPVRPLHFEGTNGTLVDLAGCHHPYTLDGNTLTVGQAPCDQHLNLPPLVFDLTPLDSWNFTFHMTPACWLSWADGTGSMDNGVLTMQGSRAVINWAGCK